MRQEYPSDETREQFEVIRYRFESLRKPTFPRKYDLYDTFFAILYVVKEGCTWKGLPHDFPKWRIKYPYYQMWGTVDESEQTSFEQHSIIAVSKAICFPLMYSLADRRK